MNSKKTITMVILMCLLFVAGGCMNKPQPKPAAEKAKLKVVATAYPVYDFARRIGGDKIELTMLVPPGVEPHEWEPTAKDLAQILGTQLFLYHGAGFEPWLGKVQTAGILSKVVAVEVSKGIPLLAADNSYAGQEHTAGERENYTDAHIWLDPVFAAQEASNIAEALCRADGENAWYYRQNASNIQQELASINEEYKRVLGTVTQRDIVTSHAAFGYLANRYQLKQVAVMGLVPDSEPTPEKVSEIIQFCKEHKVRAIFFETLVSPKLADMIAKETGVRTLVLNPIEGLNQADVEQGKDYFTLMRENLQNLQAALQ